MQTTTIENCRTIMDLGKRNAKYENAIKYIIEKCKTIIVNNTINSLKSGSLFLQICFLNET